MAIPQWNRNYLELMTGGTGIVRVIGNCNGANARGPFPFAWAAGKPRIVAVLELTIWSALSYDESNSSWKGKQDFFPKLVTVMVTSPWCNDDYVDFMPSDTAQQ